VLEPTASSPPLMQGLCYVVTVMSRRGGHALLKYINVKAAQVTSMLGMQNYVGTANCEGTWIDSWRE
jgi:hypothetical protein